MQPQKLCLKWNNHTVNLLSVLGSFQQKDILVDVTISCEGQNIKAHKMVLSACSPYFQNLFLENPCQHPIVIINGIKYEDITAILNFMYKGEVNVSQDGLSSFLQAAEALKVKGLAEVCGERKSTNSISQEAQNEQSRPQRTDTPPRKKHRNRKRSLSDSNKSDDEGTARKHHREPSSPEIHELSGDESFTGDNTSNGPPFHSSTPRVPQNIYSRSHQSSSNLGGEDDDEYEVEPSKLLEQTLTTDNVSMNNSNSDNNLRIERIMGNATEIESSNIQEPESPPDIKPIIDYGGESSAGPSDGNLMLYSEHSQPGPSSVQDGSLLHDNSHTQGKKEVAVSKKQIPPVKSKEITKKGKFKYLRYKRFTEKEKNKKVVKEVQLKKPTEKEKNEKIIKEIQVKKPTEKDKSEKVIKEVQVKKSTEKEKNEKVIKEGQVKKPMEKDQNEKVIKEIQVKKSIEKEKKEKITKEVQVRKSIEKGKRGKVKENEEMEEEAPLKEDKSEDESPEISSQKLKTVKSNCNTYCKTCPYPTSKSRDISKNLHKHRDLRLRSGLLHRRNNISLFVCPDCPYQTRNVKDIKKHMKDHSKKAEETKPTLNVPPPDSPPDIKETFTASEEPVAFTFFCYVCKEGFHNLHNLECHRKFSHVMVFNCDECDEKFSLKSALRNHKRSCHAMSSD